LRSRPEASQLSRKRPRRRAIDPTSNRETSREHGLRRHDAPGVTIEIDLDPILTARTKGCDDGSSRVVGHRARGKDRV